MIESKEITDAEEKRLLKEWFETVRFDNEYEGGLPPLEIEEDDEESRTFVYIPETVHPALSDVDFDILMEELRRRDPDNPF
jgi:hypothetical protein